VVTGVEYRRRARLAGRVLVVGQDRGGGEAARIKSGQLTSKDAWAEEREAIELSRRDFINAARRDPVGARDLVSDVPVARPPLTEIRQMFGWPPVPVHKDRSEQHDGEDDC
jgi:hypothetical protein